MEQPSRPARTRLQPDDDLGSLLRRLRGAAGLTQEELAAAAGLGVRTLRDLELGVSARPQRRTVERLAAALRVGPAERETLIERARTARIVGSGADRGDPGTAAAARSLPRDPPDFVGRAGELRELLDAGPEGGITIVNGPPGAGKTTVVIHAAHLLTAAYATVVYTELADATGTATPPGHVLGHLLTALGVESARIPADHGERLAAYRRLTSGRRGVLVLDNALDEQQVRPLLPVGTGWRVLISSRRELAGLPAAPRITVDALPEGEALRLLATAVGADRTAREPDAAAELVALCGGLPLALRVVANRLSSRPAWTLESLAERLRDARRRLDRLSAGDLDVRSAIATSYRHLPPAAQSAMRRLSLLPWPSHDDATLLALAGPDADPAVAGALHDSGLLLPAGAPGRFRLHLLTALYCAEQVTEDGATVQAEAVDRVCAPLLVTARAAADRLGPAPDAPGRPTGSQEPGRWTGSQEEAVTWLVEHHERWWWATLRLAERGRRRELLVTAESLSHLARRRRTLLPWHELFTRSVAAAVTLADRAAEARHRSHLELAVRP